MLITKDTRRRELCVRRRSVAGAAPRDYGHAFVGDAEALERIEARPWYYVGHGVIPPFQNLAALADRLGIETVSRRIWKMRPIEHVPHSWMWRDPRYRFRLAAREGNYRVFWVEPVDGSVPVRERRHVPLFGLFEIEVRNGHAYANPFDHEKIELRGTFESPSGRVVRFHGFHDGDGRGGQVGGNRKIKRPFGAHKKVPKEPRGVHYANQGP